jgi:hypothetical protein
MIMWTALTWAFIPILAIKFDVIGASIGYSLVGASSVVAILIAKKYVNFSLTNSMIKPGIGALVMGLALIVIKRFLPVSVNSMIILVLLGLIVYGASMLSMMGLSLLEDVKRSLRTIFSR